MKRASLTLSWTFAILASGLSLLPVCSAQDGGKQNPAQQKTVLRQLNPDLIESDAPQGIRLLAGYTHKSATDFEGNQVGEISKSKGVKIKYEMGFSQGMAVDPAQKASYIWYQEQKANGRVVRYALNKNKILIISIPLSSEPDSLHAANFYGTIKNPADVADMLLMILPLAYK
jgi:hypothetical protein